ncbi:SNase-domain-containing protein [Phlebopus sp. FC_14]|nr:SNase-domain-containing protein [Phlebopus sp. FC_14]
MPFHLPWPWRTRKDNAQEQSHQPAPPTESKLEHAPHPRASSNPRLSDNFLALDLDRLRPYVQPTPYSLVFFTLGAASGVGGTMVWRRWVKRIRTAEWVTPDVLARKRWVRGVVTSVGDADNFRLYHTPGIGWRRPFKVRHVPKVKGELKDQTIHIRIAGVDAPEGSHFGRPAQPHAEESLAWLKSRIEGQIVYCQLIRRDQYNRVVAHPLIPRRFVPLLLSKHWGKSLALEMLRAGVVLTYEQAGAEYGPWGREAFLRVEKEARSAKMGMWKQGKGGETPAEYKRRYAAAAAAPIPPPPSEQTSVSNARSSERGVIGWFARLWRRK